MQIRRQSFSELGAQRSRLFAGRKGFNTYFHFSYKQGASRCLKPRLAEAGSTGSARFAGKNTASPLLFGVSVCSWLC